MPSSFQYSDFGDIPLPLEHRQTDTSMPISTDLLAVPAEPTPFAFSASSLAPDQARENPSLHSNVTALNYSVNKIQGGEAAEQASKTKQQEENQETREELWKELRAAKEKESALQQQLSTIVQEKDQEITQLKVEAAQTAQDRAEVDTKLRKVKKAKEKIENELRERLRTDVRPWGVLWIGLVLLLTYRVGARQAPRD